jgi:predicted SAM-dependent methyltransferase
MQILNAHIGNVLRNAFRARPTDPLRNFNAPYKIHLGCDVVKIEGLINVDVRPTAATDIVRDCGDVNVFPDNSAELIFSHAFFEHLYRAQQIPLLTDIRRALRPDGHIFFCGIPDFEVIARCYLDKLKGNISPTFDLFEVYRYTHGDPEQHPTWWIEQLHKSLFDQHEMRRLLTEAGFTNPALFRYAYRDEPHAMNLAFIARKDGAPPEPDAINALVRQFSFIYRNTTIDLLP